MAKPNLIRRIFLAEDNVADVVLVREALEQQSLNCELTAYPNAQAAILAAERCGTDGYPVPDLMLVDLNLPCGHGCDVLEAAARNPALNWCERPSCRHSWDPPATWKELGDWERPDLL